MIRKWLRSALLLLSLSFTTTLGQAAVPQTITYQGYLKDNSGVPVSSPAKTMGFSLYSTSTGSSPIWNESQDIKVDNGIYTVELGTVNPLSLPFDSRYYLGITIPPDSEISPRTPLTSVPYAFRSATTGGVAMACQDGGVLVYRDGAWQCGSVTTLPNAAAICVGPATLDASGCSISMCSPGWGNCNPQVADGCETDIKSNLANCGSCGTVCPAPANMNSSCSAGVCSTGACLSGWGDCNNNPVDGCETGTTNDLSNCGTCGNTCLPIANGNPTCSNSICAVSSCNAGFGNCNGIYADGCEINLGSSASNCGACGVVCASGICSNSTCLKTRGSSCSADNQCVSGFCTDGVCCESRCGGTCESCAQSGRAGFCDAIPNGQDPSNECTAQSVSTCGTTGVCSGSRSCAFYPNGTISVPAFCSASTLTLASTCSGSGTSIPGGTASCAPYVCNGSSSCKTSCTIAADCISGYTCQAGVCKKDLGSDCASGTECASGFCADGFCCSAACGGICESCNQPGRIGFCDAIAAGTDPANECDPLACNGSRACQ